MNEYECGEAWKLIGMKKYIRISRFAHFKRLRDRQTNQPADRRTWPLIEVRGRTWRCEDALKKQSAELGVTVSSTHAQLTGLKKCSVFRIVSPQSTESVRTIIALQILVHAIFIAIRKNLALILIAFPDIAGTTIGLIPNSLLPHHPTTIDSFVRSEDV